MRRDAGNPYAGRACMLAHKPDGSSYEGPFWEDYRTPATLVRRGATSKPDFDYTENGLLFPQNDSAEIGYISDQMPHAWKIGTNIKPHVHYIQDEAGHPTFKLDYRVYDNGQTPGAFATITAATWVFTYAAGSILQIVSFPEIDMSGLTGLSAWFDFRLYRDDNAVAGDVLVKGFDFHYQTNSPGSRQEYTK